MNHHDHPAGRPGHLQTHYATRYADDEGHPLGPISRPTTPVDKKCAYCGGVSSHSFTCPYNERTRTRYDPYAYARYSTATHYTIPNIDLPPDVDGILITAWKNEPAETRKVLGEPVIHEDGSLTIEGTREVTIPATRRLEYHREFTREELLSYRSDTLTARPPTQQRSTRS